MASAQIRYWTPNEAMQFKVLFGEVYGKQFTRLHFIERVVGQFMVDGFVRDPEDPNFNPMFHSYRVVIFVLEISR
jgi:hypothetical protein